MRDILSVFAVMVIISVLIHPKAYAASEADCAIWLCLPGGFPTGCSAAHSAFKKRVKKGRSPLPDLSSCTTGPNGQQSSGHYQLGYEYFEPCKEGYALEQQNTNGSYMMTGRCVLKQCSYGWGNQCAIQDSYAAIRRPSPSYVKMWVDGQYLGQFFY